MRTFDARLFYTPPTEALRYLPECPRLLSNSGVAEPLLGWVAIVHEPGGATGSLNLLNLDTLENRSIDLPGRPGFFAETDEAGVVVAGIDRRLVLVNIQTGAVEETGLSVCDDDRVIINDGFAIPGGLLFGTKHLEFNQPIAALYHFDEASSTLRTAIPGQYCSNGKHYWTEPDGSVHLIDTDSIPRLITHYVFEDASMRTIMQQAPLTPAEKLPSIPDGCRNDANGETILVAYFNTDLVADGIAQQLRIDTGEPVAEWRIPGSPRVTCPEIFEWNGKVVALFTSATEGMTPEHRALAPHAGCFYIADTDLDRAPAPPALISAASLRGSSAPRP